MDSSSDSDSDGGSSYTGGYTATPGLGGGISSAGDLGSYYSPTLNAGTNTVYSGSSGNYGNSYTYTGSSSPSYALDSSSIDSSDLSVEDSSWSIPNYLRKFAVGKAGQYIGAQGLGPMGPIATAGLDGGLAKGLDGATEAAGQTVGSTAFNMFLTAANPLVGLGTSLYGSLTGNTPYKSFSSWVNPTNAKAPMYDSPGKISGSGNSGTNGTYKSTGTGSSDSSSKVSWGWEDLFNLGASAAGENKVWSDIFDSYSPPSTGSGLKNPGYTLGDTSAPTQPGLQNVSLGAADQTGLQVSPDASYNPYQQVAQQYNTPTTSQFNLPNIGKSVMNNSGTLAQTLMGLYTQQRNRSALNRQISGLESLYNPNGAYSQQLRAKLNAQAAQQGKRSNTSAREVQLQAMLAEKAASLAPSLYQMQTGVNSSYATTLDTLLGAYRKWE
jgi:hypothetical protein